MESLLEVLQRYREKAKETVKSFEELKEMEKNLNKITEDNRITLEKLSIEEKETYEEIKILSEKLEEIMY